MQGPTVLTVSGAGIVSAAVPNQISQLVAVLPRPDTTVALAVKLYSCPSQPSGSIPAGSTLLAEFTGPLASAGVPLNLAPDGVSLGGWIAAQFTDTGTAHALYCYLK
jgi:hypothetical protein